MGYRFTVAALVAACAMTSCERQDNPAADMTDAAMPVLDPQAASAALDLVRQDANAPIAEVQYQLAQAASDGSIEPYELSIQGPDGPIDLVVWLHDKRLLSVADHPDEGPYLALTSAGQRFLEAAPASWFEVKSEGAPQMHCLAASSVTSANCSASIGYTTIATSALFRGLSIPQSMAQLDAAFAPGQGWSVTRLAPEGDMPAVQVRRAVFGTAQERQIAQERFAETIQTRFASLDEAEGMADPSSDSASDSIGEEGFGVRDVPVTAPMATGPALPSTKVVSPPSTIVNASYARRPSAEELASVYPPAALERGLSGRSAMTCLVTTSGALADCETTLESPPRSRFGQAGVSAGRFFRMNPRTVDGQPVESRAEIAIQWTPQ